MAASKNNTAVAKAKGTAVAAGFDYGEDSGVGFEGTTSSDLAIPFMHILQDLSKLVKEKVGEPGQIYNSVTQELIAGDVGFVFQPVFREIVMVEWKPRNKGGGYVGRHEMNDGAVLQAIKANGQAWGSVPFGENEIMETHYYYGLILSDDGKTVEGFAVVPFTSTKIKIARQFYTAMKMTISKPPMYANRARITTKGETASGGDYFNIRVSPLNPKGWKESLIDPVGEAHLIVEARQFSTLIDSGEAKPDFETGATAGDDPASDVGGNGETKTPF